MEAPPSSPPRRRILAVASNKGGVGKTTLATNLAIYLRALREALPVLLVGLDDQSVIDRMFALEPVGPEGPNLKHAWAERCLDRAVRLGEYGVHFVPSPPDTGPLKSRAQDPRTLARILERTKWDGVLILDTKSDLEELTRNALVAADRVLLPVADRASLEEAGKAFELLDKLQRGRARARLVFTLVDARTRLGGMSDLELHELLEEEAAHRGWPRYRTALSRSPRAEALMSAGGAPLSILHHARGTHLFRQMRALTDEVIADTGLDELALELDEAGFRAPPPPAPPSGRASVTSWKSALLRGGRGR